MNIDNIIEEANSLGMTQNNYEIREAIKFLDGLEINSFMEIGTDRGGTFICWSRVCKNVDGLKISVDWAHGPFGLADYDVYKRNSYLKSLGNNVHILEGDSHSESIHADVKNIINNNKLDFLFIDGDHTHLGVKLDYHMYKEFVKPGGWIGFHDIKETDWHTGLGCRVDLLWNELPNEKVWFLTDNEWGGIGFIKV